MTAEFKSIVEGGHLSKLERMNCVLAILINSMDGHSQNKVFQV